MSRIITVAIYLTVVLWGAAPQAADLPEPQCDCCEKVSPTVAEERGSLEQASTDLDIFVKSALQDFSKETNFNHLTFAQLQLRSWLLFGAGAGEVACNRRTLQNMRVNQEFLTLFDRQVDWYGQVSRLDGKSLYEMSEELQSMDHGNVRLSELNHAVANGLMHKAAEKEFFPALWNRAHYYFAEAKDTSDICLGVGMLRTLMRLGDVEAAVELAERYRDGKGVRQDLAQALFWFVHAAMFSSSKDLNAAAQMVNERISGQDRVRFQYWLDEGLNPNCWQEEERP